MTHDEHHTSAYAFLERVLPLAALLLAALVLASADDHVLFLGLFAGHTVVNISLSKLIARFLTHRRVEAELAKNAINVIYVALVILEYGAGSRFWVLHFLAIFRVFVVFRRTWQQTASALALGGSATVATWLSGADLATSLEPAIVVVVPVILAGVIFSFLRDHIELLHVVERRYQRLADVSPVGIIELEGERCTYINEQWSTLTGQSFEEATLGQWSRGFNESFAALFEPDVDESAVMEVLFEHPERGEMWLLCKRTYSASPGKGSAAHRVATIIDITQRKRHQEGLAELQSKLVVAARQAGMADTATGVLHNVGNVLNSVGVSARIISQEVTGLGDGLRRATQLLPEDEPAATELVQSPRYGKLVQLLKAHANRIGVRRERLRAEATELMQHVEHIRDVVTKQQAFATLSGTREPCDAHDLVADAVSLIEPKLHGSVRIACESEAVAPVVVVDRHKVLQILVNLLRNAVEAVDSTGRDDGQVSIETRVADGEVSIGVSDNGMGIDPEHMERLFKFGFTTKDDGHGFGLHSSHLAATDAGGSLRVESEGPGRGATFTLALPAADTAVLCSWQANRDYQVQESWRQSRAPRHRPSGPDAS